MFQTGTQTLIDVWTALPDSQRIPMRSALDPVRLGETLPRAFLAERSNDDATFRLAGGRIEDLHGRPLRGASWLGLWNDDSRALVVSALIQTFREGRPVVLIAEAPGLSGLLEIAIAPLRGPKGAADRLLGLYQPCDAADRRADDAGPLTARLSIGVGEARRAPLTLASMDGRRIA